MSDPATAPTHDELHALAVDETRAALYAMGENYEKYASSPQTWPHLAATFDFFARKLQEHAATLAENLAAYAAAHPEITPDDEGVPVLLLPKSEHAGYWEISDGTVEDYGRMVSAAYGRPGLTDSAVDLTPLVGTDLDAVVVFQYFDGSLVADRPCAARVLIGGLQAGVHDNAIDGVLAHYGITPIPPKFWPPLRTEGTVLSVHTGVYDVFGRPLDGPTEDELVARAGREMT
jgi:hypothetical protein